MMSLSSTSQQTLFKHFIYFLHSKAIYLPKTMLEQSIFTASVKLKSFRLQMRMLFSLIKRNTNLTMGFS